MKQVVLWSEARLMLTLMFNMILSVWSLSGLLDGNRLMSILLGIGLLNCLFMTLEACRRNLL